MFNWSYPICPLASDPRPSQVVFLHSLAADKNGRPMILLRPTGHFIAIPKMESVLSLMCTDFLSVLKIRPHIEEVSLKFSGQIQDGTCTVG